MPQQKGVKRAAKVAVRKRKIEARRKEANLKKLANPRTAQEQAKEEQKS